MRHGSLVFGLLLSCLTWDVPAMGAGYWRTTPVGDTFLSELHPGQVVILKESGTGYILECAEDGYGQASAPEVRLEVMDIGADFVVFKDIGFQKRMSIPVYAIRRIDTPISHRASR
jgi:hypothetical protein